MTETISAAVATDSGLSCLAIVSRFFGRPLDPEQLRHEFASPSTAAAAAVILRAAKRSGLKARRVRGDWRRLERSHPPAIAELGGGRFVVIARVAPDKVLIDDPGEQRPRTLSRAEFEALWTGDLILIASRARLADAMRRFDFTWFIPAILRYRRMFADVLVASFFLQLFALVTPLFFQVVVDKVLVHRGLSTLDVLVFALVVVTLFEAALGGVRAYVFAHTTSRIDVELGARLFHHVLALPLAYFQARRVGDTVARVRELETIRNFLTGSAVTVVIDVGFTFVFLAVMYWYSALLTGIVLATIPAYVVLSLFVTPVLRRRLDEKFNRGAENQAFLVEAVTGVETVKAMAVEPRLRQRWEEQLAGYVGSAFRAGNLAAWAGQGVGMVNKLAMAAILWAGARLVIEGALTVGELVAFNMLAGRVGGPIMRLAQLWQDFQQVRIAVERLG
ncbi:MAG TPA: ABC transporter transmembrane domain-containing protein, partial [Alphaproteobacteria bacterium]|nr:ABC transporter transmembrane domain-containing protein [Alphaproteobacteria bacterium]